MIVCPIMPPARITAWVVDWFSRPFGEAVHGRGAMSATLHA